ncbi:hypothetical protein D8B26_003212 [Coccidioides posadasii str. Silveira]|nr:hypothetical protein D8B26_003212 [Coccidioides posadasii str. Silveira]
MTLALLPSVRASVASYWTTLVSNLPPALHASVLHLETATSQSIAAVSSRVAFFLPFLPFSSSLGVPFALAATALAVLLATLLITMTSWRRSNVWRDVPSPFGAFFRAPQVRDEDFDYVGPEELGAGWRRPSFGRLDSMRDLGPQRAAGGEHVYDEDDVENDNDDDDDDDDEREPDVLRLRHHTKSYLLQFPAFAIGDGILTVGDVRRAAGNVLNVSRLRRIKLLYKGRLLKDDNASAKSVGLKQNSLIMCVVSEDFGSDDDSTSESEVGEFARYRTNYEREPRRRLSSPPGGRRRAQSKRKDARVDRHREDESEAGPRSEPRISHSQPPRPRISPHIPHPTESKPSSPLSAPMSPALTPSSRMPTPSPMLNSSQTPREKLRILDDYVDKVLKPLIKQYIEQPPHDQKALEMEHKRLSETAMTQVLLKADGVELEGDGVARKQRKALILKVQSLLKSLDAAAKH